MLERTKWISTRPEAVLGTVVLSLFFDGTVLAEDGPPSATPQLVAPKRGAFDFLLTREELRRIALRHWLASADTDQAAEDDVIVTGSRELLPMRDVTQEVWGGAAAPLWAIMNPKESWRIFLPIPPKD